MIPYDLKKSVNASHVTELYEISDLAHNNSDGLSVLVYNRCVVVAFV